MRQEDKYILMAEEDGPGGATLWRSCWRSSGKETSSGKKAGGAVAATREEQIKRDTGGYI